MVTVLEIPCNFRILDPDIPEIINLTWDFLPNWTWEINLFTQLITQVVLANNWANIISFIKEVMKYFFAG